MRKRAVIARRSSGPSSVRRIGSVDVKSKASRATTTTATTATHEKKEAVQPAKKKSKKPIQVLDVESEQAFWSDEEELEINVVAPKRSLEGGDEEGGWMCIVCDDIQDEDDSVCPVCGEARDLVVDVAPARSEKRSSKSSSELLTVQREMKPAVSIPSVLEAPSPSVSLCGPSYVARAVEAMHHEVMDTMETWVMDPKEMSLARVGALMDHLELLEKKKKQQIEEHVKSEEKARHQRKDEEQRRAEALAEQRRKLTEAEEKRENDQQTEQRLKRSNALVANQKVARPLKKSTHKRLSADIPEVNTLRSATLFLTGHSHLEMHIEGGAILGRGNDSTSLQNCLSVSREQFFVRLLDDNYPVQATIRKYSEGKRDAFVNGTRVIGIEEQPLATGDTISFYINGRKRELQFQWTVQWNREDKLWVCSNGGLSSDSSDDEELAQLLAEVNSKKKKKRKKSLPKKKPPTRKGQAKRKTKPKMKVREVDVGSFARGRKKSSSLKSASLRSLSNSSGQVIVIDSDDE